jgi:hypothetical protein
MAVTKEASYGDKDPLFLRVINRKITIIDLLNIFSNSDDSYTVSAAQKALTDPPDIEYFRKQLEEAVRDIIKEGPNEEFKAFVNNFMEPSVYQYSNSLKTPFGENKRHMVYVKDENSTWVEGLICFNLSLYIKAFGLDNLKSCKSCNTIFAHKGKWAVYCTDACNPKKR